MWFSGIFNFAGKPQINIMRKKLKIISIVTGTTCVIFSLILALYVLLVPPPKPLWENIDFSPIILDRDEKLLRLALTNDEKFRLRVTLSEIPIHVQNAALLYEDKYFYSHLGVNPVSVLRAIKNSFFGTRRIGASTIAMQLARLRYKLITNTVFGKLRQMLIALQLVAHYGHEEVLEAYFNLAPYGGNIEGISAASRIYFQTPIQNLSKSQAIALSLVPQNPRSRAFKSLDKGKLAFHENLEKARNILHEKWNETYKNDMVSTKAPPLRIFTTKDLPLNAPHLTTEILQDLKHSNKRSIVTSIDKKAQDLLERNIKEFVMFNHFYGINNAAAMLLHFPSMEVRALVGSADFNAENIHGQVDGTRAKRSPGSTLKPLIYALAMDQGIIHPQTMLMDSPKSFAEYNPENFDKQFQGPLPAHEALRLSRNLPAIWLASKLEPNLYASLKKANVKLNHAANHYGLSLVLGGAELSMRELVGLYASLANGGIWQELKFIKDTQANELIPLISKEAGLATLYMLEENKQKYVGYANYTNQSKLPFRYKTGTSNGFRDAWAIGIVGEYVLAVWLGNFDNSSNSMLIGNRVATPLYKQIANELEYSYKLKDILAEKYKKTNLIQIDTCRDTGDVQTELCKEKVATWFIPGRSPIKNSGVYRKIWIDEASGLRLCEKTENAKEVIWEFWPSELYQLFSQAGLHKPLAPEFLNECDNFENEQNTIMIQNPKAGITYHIGANSKLTLNASTTAHAKMLFWFVNDEFIGSVNPNDTLLWKMKAGKHNILVVDDLGQSDSLTIEVLS